jgi:alpha-beta hydrolase superfamily lysophospholipase
MYRFILDENRVYKHWYGRFLLCGVDLDRIRRVVKRIRNFYEWCGEWSKEGREVEKLAENALSNGNTLTARRLFHEAAGCFHVGQHVNFFDVKRKTEAQERVRENYRRAIELYDEEQRPIRIEIAFRGTVIPGYLRLVRKRSRPLVILINGGDNVKEVENHYLGSLLLDAGLASFAFDGPGQGEMWKNMKMIPDYEKAVSAIIDWFEGNREYRIDLHRIGACGMSLGGYLSPRAAAFDKRISCAVGNGGFGHLNLKTDAKKLSPLIVREILHITGFENIEEAAAELGSIDIKQAQPLDRPLLFIQGGEDKVIPNPKEQADYIMDWAVGEKELRFYPDGEHCCGNYFDEAIPYIVDWLRKHLFE